MFFNRTNCQRLLRTATGCWLFVSILSFANQPDQQAYRVFFDRAKTLDSLQRIEALEAFIRQHSSIEDAYLLLAEYYLQHPSLSANRTFLSDLLNESSDNGHQAFARWLTVRSRRTLAISDKAKLLQEAIVLKPKSVWLWAAYGRRAIKKGLTGENLSAHIRRTFPGISRDYQNLVAGFYRYQHDQYRQMIAAFRELPDSLANHIQVLNTWAYGLDTIGQPTAALKLWQHAAQKAEEQGFFFHFVGISGLAGVSLFQEACNFKAAEMTFDKMLYIGERIHYLNHGYAYLGDYYKNAGQISKAKHFLTLALNDPKYSQAYRKTAELKRLLAMCFYYDDEYPEALKLHLEARTARPGRAQRKKIYQDQFEVYYSLREKPLIRNNLSRILAIDPVTHDSIKLGKWYALIGDTMRARQVFQSCLLHFERHRGSAKCQWEYFYNAHLAKAYFASGGLFQALQHYQVALRAAKNAGATFFSGVYHIQIAAILTELQQFEQATEALANAEAAAIAIRNEELFRRIALGKGILALRNERFMHADSFFTIPASLLEKTRSKLSLDDLRVGYFAEAVSAYQFLAISQAMKYSRQADADLVDAAIVNFERGRARVLKEQKLKDNPARAQKLSGEAQRLYKFQRSTRQPARLDSIAHRRQKLKLDSMRVDFRERYLGSTTENYYSVDVLTEDPHYLSKLQNQLSRIGAAIILYQLHREYSFAIVITPLKKEIVPLPLSVDSVRTRLDRLMRPLLSASGNYGSVSYGTHVAHKLYQDLFEPLEPLVSQYQQLLVVPDPAMNQLPLEILQREKTGEAHYTPLDAPDDYMNGFLFCNHSFTYLPSSEILLGSANITNSPQKMTLLGDPTYLESRPETIYNGLSTIWGFQQLGGSRREAQSILENYSLADTVFADDFTKSQVIHALRNSDWVHMTSHGVHDPRLGSFSGLAVSLGEDSLDDGFLLGHEIRHLPVRANLVSLNACETGKAESVSGEGVLGLPRLLLGAGAATVVMTRWKVDNAYAVRIMPRFYDNLRKEGLSRSLALHQAQQNSFGWRGKPGLSAEYHYQHPFFWAAYGVYGHPGAPTGDSPAAGLLGIVSVLAIAGWLWWRRGRLRD